mgnify:CR=1 FL=1
MTRCASQQVSNTGTTGSVALRPGTNAALLIENLPSSVDLSQGVLRFKMLILAVRSDVNVGVEVLTASSSDPQSVYRSVPSEQSWNARERTLTVFAVIIPATVNATSNKPIRQSAVVFRPYAKGVDVAQSGGSLPKVLIWMDVQSRFPDAVNIRVDLQTSNLGPALPGPHRSLPVSLIAAVCVTVTLAVMIACCLLRRARQQRKMRQPPGRFDEDEDDQPGGAAVLAPQDGNAIAGSRPNAPPLELRHLNANGVLEEGARLGADAADIELAEGAYQFQGEVDNDEDVYFKQVQCCRLLGMDPTRRFTLRDVHDSKQKVAALLDPSTFDRLFERNEGFTRTLNRLGVRSRQDRRKFQAQCDQAAAYLLWAIRAEKVSHLFEVA